MYFSNPLQSKEVQIDTVHPVSASRTRQTQKHSGCGFYPSPYSHILFRLLEPLAQLLHVAGLLPALERAKHQMK